MDMTSESCRKFVEVLASNAPRLAAAVARRALMLRHRVQRWATWSVSHRRQEEVRRR
ncbi:MAG: hypothetical protein ACLU9S_13665 [Oscillospiraceae bacterium]